MNMRSRLISLISACGLFLAMQCAHATYSCSITSPGWVSSYFPADTINATRTAQVTISCTRASADPTTMTYAIEEDLGLHVTGGINQAISGANLIKYNEYQDAAFTQVLGNCSPKKNAIFGTLDFGTGTSANLIIPYYASIPFGQNVAGGNYTDTVTFTLAYPNPTNTCSGASIATNSHSVLIIVNPICTINVPPGNFNFAYKSFQTAAVTASTIFALTCTLYVPYSVGLDAYAVTDTTTNIAYTLNVGQNTRPAGSKYTAGAALTASGSGSQQLISIDARVAGGQIGTCSSGLCSGSTMRTMTITY